MRTHPDLENFILDRSRLGPSAAFSITALGMAILQLMLKEPVICALLGALDVSPMKTPLPALDRYLLQHVGVDATQRDAKMYTGRLVRLIVEHLGGTFVRDGADIQMASIFTTGSIYTLPTTARLKGDADTRRNWAIEQILARGYEPKY